MEVVNTEAQEQTTCSNCASLAQELASTKAELEATKAINAELTKEIESFSTKAESTGTGEPSFEIGGQIFGFHFHKTFFLGKALTHTDVLQDPELQKQLVEIGSGMIKAK